MLIGPLRNLVGRIIPRRREWRSGRVEERKKRRGLPLFSLESSGGDRTGEAVPELEEASNQGAGFAPVEEAGGRAGIDLHEGNAFLSQEVDPDRSSVAAK